MKLSEQLAEQLRLGQGLEAKLLRRRRFSSLGFAAGLLGAIVQLVAFAHEEKLAAALGGFADGAMQFVVGLCAWIAAALHGRFAMPAQWAGLPMREVVGALLVVAVWVWAWLLRWTRFLMKESREPFRYSFGVDAFAPVPETPGDRFKLGDQDSLRLLQHDVRERLSRRIGRLSLLDAAAPAQPGEAGGEKTRPPTTAHIQIGGVYALREHRRGHWAVHAMPQVRIGPTGTAWTIALPVHFSLVGGGDRLGPERYEQLVERVYSSVATEVYRAIELDVRGKIELFPTAYLRAVALYHEAEDLARSNTIDAYEPALLLYREALRHFETAGVKRIVHDLAWHLPLAWRRAARVDHMRARIAIGYAKCMVYRRMLSTQSGRPMNTIFELRALLDGVAERLDALQDRLAPSALRRRLHGVARPLTREWRRFGAFFGLLTEPADTWYRRWLLQPSQALFESQRQLLFEARAVGGLGLAELGAAQAARAQLDLAAALLPSRTDSDPVYLLARAGAEPAIDDKVRLLARAVEQAPEFQIVQFQLAYWMEMRWRQLDQIDALRVQRVVDEYDRVLKINPGNVAALAAQGYLLWLVDQPDEAAACFERGRELKAVVQQTFIGELNHGLARIAAERGELGPSHDLYLEAVEADPGVGAYSLSAPGQRAATVRYFECMSVGMLRRYTRFRRRVVDDAVAVPGDEHVRRIVQSYVLNDYGNACLNFYIRFGHDERLREAVRVLRAAVDAAPNSLVAAYNLAAAQDWRDDSEAAERRLDELIERASHWREPKVLRARIRVERIEDRRSLVEEAQKAVAAQHKAASAQLQAANSQLETAKAQLDLAQRQPKPVVAANAPDAWLQEVARARKAVDRQVAEVKRLAAEVDRLAAEVDDSPERIGQVGQDALDAVLSCATLGLLEFGFTIDAKGRGLEDLLGHAAIRWDRLDEFDVYALRHWAKVVSRNSGDAAALQRAELLCEHLLERYNPEDLDVLLTSLNALSPALGARPTASEKVARRRTGLRGVVEDWCSLDAVHWQVLRWARTQFEPQRYLALLERAVGTEMPNHELLFRLAEARASADGSAPDRRDDLEAQVRTFEAALADDPGHAEIREGLARALGQLAAVAVSPGSAGVESLRLALARLQQASALAPLDPGHARRAQALRSRFALLEHFDARSVAHGLGVVRLGIGLTADLAVLVAGSETVPSLVEALDDWRNRVRQSTGVPVPEVQLWRYPPGAMTRTAVLHVDLRERARVEGLWPERRLYRGPVDESNALEVEAVEAIDPLTSESVAWVDRADWSAVDKLGRPWSDAARVVVDRLDRVVRESLADFVGHDEVMDALEACSPEEHARLAEQSHELAALVAVLRGLVAEGVSIRPLAAISREFARRRALGDGVASVIAAVRLLPELRPDLRGTGPLLRLEPAVQAVLEQALRASPDAAAAALVLPYAQREQALASLDPAIAAARPGALVVTRSALRAHVAALVHTRWPTLAVLAEGELDAAPVSAPTAAP